jgi:protein O-GlcNAc transferase
MGLIDRLFRRAVLARKREAKPVIATARAVASIDAGNIIEDEGRLEQAMVHYDNAIRIDPSLARAHLNRGNVLLKMGRMGPALECYENALRLDPSYAAAPYNIGNAHLHADEPMAALAAYDRALAINPEFVDCQLARANVLDDLGRFDAALQGYLRVLELRPDYFEARSNLLFSHNYRADYPAELMLADARGFGALAARHARPARTWCNTRDPDRCLRIGLMSGDLRNHPVGYFVEGILAALARTAAGRLALYAYPALHVADDVSERIRALCHAWYPTAGISDSAVVDKVMADEIDILLDLSGHTAGNRLGLFAWKPAPVQATWLGYWATTGLAEMDYLIADPCTLPVSEEKYFTEKIWRLPETRLCFTPPSEDVPPSRLPALDNGHVTFGCFNNLSKMNDAVVKVWGRILRDMPTSRLILKSRQLNEAPVRKEVEQRFSREGIAADRLTFLGPSSRADYLAAYRRIDIALDPFPFPGGTTSAEALWMGVPVLTLIGEHFLSRQGMGILTNAGLSAWIADSMDDYVTRAVSHASDLGALAALRDGLRQQVLASPLFDARRFAHHFEGALRAMWHRWCAQDGAI